MAILLNTRNEKQRRGNNGQIQCLVLVYYVNVDGTCMVESGKNEDLARDTVGYAVLECRNTA